MTRTQYITVAELQTILNDMETYPDDDATLLKIYEASELIKAYCWQIDDYTAVTAPDNLKLAVAYQVQYMTNNPDMDSMYSGGQRSVSIGQTSENIGFGGTGSQEWQKISPKSVRYLLDTAYGQPLVVRVL